MIVARVGGVRTGSAGGLCVLAAWAGMAVAQPAPAPSAAAVPTEGKCGLLLDTPDGKGMFRPRPDLHPLEQTGPARSLRSTRRRRPR